MKHYSPAAFDQPDPLRTEEDMVVELATRLDGRRGEHGRLAGHLGIKQGTLSNILTGGRPIGADVAERLGFRRVVRFEPIDS